MNRVLCFLAIAGFSLSLSSQAVANSKLKAAFGKEYAGDKADDDYKALVKKGGCYVCHVKGEDKKKVRNVYGEALHELFEKDDFPMAEFKKDPEKYTERVKAIFKKALAEKSGDEKHKTFGDRIKAKLLPGGNVEGKKDE